MDNLAHFVKSEKGNWKGKFNVKERKQAIPFVPLPISLKLCEQKMSKSMKHMKWLLFRIATRLGFSQIRIWWSGKMMIQAGYMGACEIMDSMGGSTREHMFTLSCIERAAGKPMKLPSDKLKHIHGSIFWPCIIKFVEFSTTEYNGW